MMQQAPNPFDIQDFQFKLHCHLKIFNNEDTSLIANPCSLLASASQYGLIFVGTNFSAFQVIKISSIEKYTNSGYHRRLIDLPAQPKYLAVNCDGTKLAVIVKEMNGTALALFYEVSSFTKQDVTITRQLHLSIKPEVNVLQICWNPAVANIFSACKDDGTLGVYELKENTVDINELPMEAQATCMSWSPKGKQIAVGSRNGKITQYKPDLKAMKVINAPPLEGVHHIIALQWISNYQFIAIFKPPDPDSSANLLVIDSPKTGDTIYINYEDVCYGYGNARLSQFYIIYQPVWNVLMVASSNSMEVGVMGCQGEQWTQWILSDTARAELPLTPSKQESLPIGFALDTAATDPVIWGETSLAAAPILLILSYEGLLSCFRAINIKADAQNICQKPEILTDNSGLFVLFSETKERGSKMDPITQSVKAIIAQAEPFMKQPIKIDTTVKSSPIAVTVSSATQFVAALREPSLTTPHPSTNQNEQLISTVQSVAIPTESLPLMSSIANVTPLQLNEASTIQKEADMLIASLIREECETLEAELKLILHKASLIRINLGTDAEAAELVNATDVLQDFLAEVIETNTAQNTEICALKQALIQTWAWYEDARFRLAQTRDTTLEALLRLQQLDPVSQRYLAESKRMSYYLDSQIKQADHVLDDQWSNFQDKCKKIVRTKIPTMETIYQTMVRHSIILEKQKYILKDIGNRNRALRSRLSGPSLLVCLNSSDLLEKSLKRLQLEPEKHFFEAQYEMVLQKHKSFTQTKINKLTMILRNRDVTNVKINKPQFSTNLHTLLQSSPRIKRSMEATLIGAGLSPITTKPPAMWNSTFIQSTPKPTIPRNLEVHKNAPITSGQKIGIGELSKSSLGSVNDYNLSSFTFIPPKSNTSAFVPTTQLAFSFTNKSVNTTASDTIFSSTFTFGGSSLFTIGTSAGTTITVTTPKVVTASVPTDNKSLPASQPSSTSIFGTAAQNIFTSSVPITTVTPSFIPKSTSPTTFNFMFNTPSTTFATNVVNSVPTFNFAPATAPFVFSSTTTAASNWLSKTPLYSIVTSTEPTSSSSASSGNLVDSPSAKVSSESLLSVSSRTLTDVVVTSANSLVVTPFITIPELQLVKTTQSNNVFSNATSGLDLSTKSTATSTSVVNVFSNTIVTTQPTPETFSSVLPETISADVVNTSSTDATELNTSITALVPLSTSSSTFSSADIVVPFLSSTTNPTAITANKSPTNITNVFGVTSTITTNSSFVKKSDAQSVFGVSRNTSDLFTATSTSGATGDIKSSIGFTAASTTTSVLFNSISSTQTPIFSQKATPTFGMSATSTTDAVTTASLSGSTTPATKILFGSPFATQSSTLENTVLTSTTSNLFQAPTTTTGPFFSAISSNMQNIFGNKSAVSSTPTLSFGATTSTTSTQSIFNTLPKTLGSVPVLGPAFDSTTNQSTFTFQTAVTSNTNLLGSVTTTAGSSIFGSAPTTTTSLFTSPISSPMSSSSIFGAQTTQSGSIFGSSAITTASIFGTTTTTSTPIFGSGPFTNTSSSVFGMSAKPTPFSTPPSGSIFGQQPTFGGTAVFGVPIATSASTFGSNNSIFGTPQSSENTTFGSADVSKPFSFTLPAAPTSTSSFGFGNLNMGSNDSSFNGQTSNPFSKPFDQEQKPFGGGSIFGTPSTSTTVFGSNAPTFGFGSSNGFGSSAFNQQSTFAQQSAFGSPSQSGPFSRGSQSVSQTGFGGFVQQTPKSGFGAAPVFGGSPSGGFGSAPAFGGSAFNTSFGSPNNSSQGLFGQSSPQNSTFANLANQDTIGFGALAQQSSPSQPNQTSFNGGSSFSTWR